MYGVQVGGEHAVAFAVAELPVLLVPLLPPQGYQGTTNNLMGFGRIQPERDRIRKPANPCVVRVSWIGSVWKKQKNGASGRGRTGTTVRSRDFKSLASTNFATEAGRGFRRGAGSWRFSWLGWVRPDHALCGKGLGLPAVNAGWIIDQAAALSGKVPSPLAFAGVSRPEPHPADEVIQFRPELVGEFGGGRIAGEVALRAADADDPGTVRLLADESADLLGEIQGTDSPSRARAHIAVTKADRG